MAIIILTTTQAFKGGCMPLPQRANNAPKNALLQGSYRVFGSEIQDFLQTFLPKQLFLFPDSRLSNRWSVETLKDARNKAFFVLRCKHTGEIELRFDQTWRKKKTYKALVVA